MGRTGLETGLDWRLDWTGQDPGHSRPVTTAVRGKIAGSWCGKTKGIMNPKSGSKKNLSGIYIYTCIYIRVVFFFSVPVATVWRKKKKKLKSASEYAWWYYMTPSLQVCHTIERNIYVISIIEKMFWKSFYSIVTNK